MTSPYGYLLWNCEITRDAKGGKSAPSNNTYYLGRPWGAGASVAAVNCKIDSHVRTGTNRFTDMSGNSNSNARWYEYNTMKMDGSAYPSSIYASYETVLTEDEVYAKHNPYNYLKAKYNKKLPCLMSLTDGIPADMKT